MWKYLAIQGVLFFLFFQPDLVAIRSARILLIIIGSLSSAVALLYASMDPFVWLLYTLAIALTYMMAQRALRWVSANRQKMRDEVMVIETKSKSFHEMTSQKDKVIDGLQNDISKVSLIYDKVKEMSKALEFLDAFVDLGEVLMENFTLERARLIMVRTQADGDVVIEKVHQIDQRYMEFSAHDRNVISADVMFRGEAFPFDVRLIEWMQKNPSVVKEWGAGKLSERSFAFLPPDVKGYVAIPVQTEFGLQAVLTLEGLVESEYPSLEIIIDRFISEFHRIKLYADVQRLAITDWLTGAYVRRYFFKRLEEEVGRSERFDLKFSFLMIDLDFFKKCNDEHGHLVGDAVLKQTAYIIKKMVREVDLVGRYGGEEFAAILLDTDENGAMYVAERIRKAIDEHRFKIYDLDLHITTSIGFATYHPNIREASEIVEWADSALYQAKRQGKNRVCAYIQR